MIRVLILTVILASCGVEPPTAKNSMANRIPKKAAKRALAKAKKLTEQRSVIVEFREAVVSGNLKDAKALIAGGVDVNSRLLGMATALTVAADEGHLEMAKMLIEKGAIVNDYDHDLERTPIMHAASRGHLEIVNMLIEKGAIISNIFKDREGRTTLDIARQSGFLKVEKFLLNRLEMDKLLLDYRQGE